MGLDHPPVVSSGWRNWPKRWQALTSAGVLALILLIAGALIFRLDLRGGQALATATKTPLPSPSVAPTRQAGIQWQMESLPPDVSLGVSVTGRAHADFALSPSRGRRAWICAPTTAGQVNVWSTQDLGTSWQLASTLTPVTPEPIGSCHLVAATNDSDLLVLEVWWGAGEGGTLRALSYISIDGGAHWRLVAGKMDIRAVDEVDGVTFALLVDTTMLTDPNQHAILVASRDEMRTWRSIAPPDLAGHDSVFQFWVAPTTGQVLAATYGSTLWRSEDSGARWEPVPTPRSQIDQALWIAHAQRWLLCSSATMCSKDLGATWTDLPPTHCPPKGLTSDAALILVCLDLVADVSRLQVDTKTVTSLGNASWSLVYLAPTGEMWSVHGQQAAVTVLPLVAS
jgi:hypothetical protein